MELRNEHEVDVKITKCHTDSSAHIRNSEDPKLFFLTTWKQNPPSE